MLQTQDEAYHSTEVVRFLRLLLRKIAGKLLLLWDGAPLHRGQPSKDFLSRGTARRIHLEHLPGYAPDLNPVEGLWNDLKCRELGTVCCRDFAELDTKLRRAPPAKSVSVTSATSFAAASPHAVINFSHLYRDQ
jgi:transposase